MTTRALMIVPPHCKLYPFPLNLYIPTCHGTSLMEALKPPTTYAVPAGASSPQIGVQTLGNGDQTPNYSKKTLINIPSISKSIAY